MPRFEVDQRSVRVTVRNFQGARRAARQAGVVAAAIAGNRLLRAVRANVSIPPIGGTAASHKAALAALDHPYAARHGEIQIKPSGGVPGFGSPELKVHTVSGALLGAISGTLDPRTATYTVRADPSVEHVRYVIRGTRVMLARDILWATANDPVVRREILQVATQVYGRLFRSKASLRLTTV